jgi:hypothetical protein
MDSRLPARRPFPARSAGDEWLVRDAETGQVHFLNATAALVWRCCDGLTTIESCDQQLRESFSVPEGTMLAEEILATVRELEGRGLIDGGTGCG